MPSLMLPGLLEHLPAPVPKVVLSLAARILYLEVGTPGESGLGVRRFQTPVSNRIELASHHLAG